MQGKTMLNVIRNQLSRIIGDIDNGNCDLSEDEMQAVIDDLRRYLREERIMSKYEACRYLGISRATFDRKVREGELPKGRKMAGFKELAWRKTDIDNKIHRH